MKKYTKLASDVSTEVPSVQEDVKTKLAEELSKIRMAESQDSIVSQKTDDKEPWLESQSNTERECASRPLLSMQGSVSEELLRSPNKGIFVISHVTTQH